MSKPYPCVYCTEYGYCKKYSDEQVTSWCVQSPCKDEKPSNGDRIRRSTDAELAALIAHSIACSACPEFPCRKTEQECTEAWERWLKKEEEKKWPC